MILDLAEIFVVPCISYTFSDADVNSLLLEKTGLHRKSLNFV